MKDPSDIGFGLTGVAPEASLYMYRIFSCAYEYTDEDIILNAMTMAAEAGVDLISMSLGFTWYFESGSPFTELVKQITAQGIAIIASNGNDGSYGIYSESAPANSPGVLAVGSTTNTVFPRTFPFNKVLFLMRETYLILLSPVTYTAKDSKGGSFQYGSVWPVNAPAGLKIFYHGNDVRTLI